MLTQCRILTLDDDILQCTHIEHLLQDAGLQNITQAYTAHDALRQLHRHHHQLVILDLDMPDIDGIQFINQLALQNLKPMLVISSSYSTRILNSVSTMAKEQGFSVIGAFPKPFSAEQAQQVINQLLSPAKDNHSSPHTVPQITELDANLLNRALDNNEIQGWFQPKLSLHTQQIVGAEVLTRWQRPMHGLVQPNLFLPSIKQHGLEQNLLFKMLDDGLKAHATWHNLGYTIPISINLPVSLLQIADLPDRLHAIVTQKGIAPGSISFELLEDETLSTPGLYQMGASRMRLKGFGLSQDDFGCGYSSMYNLLATPYTELKVDKSFVTDASNDEIRIAALRSAVTLGHKLNLTVTAEGVETQEDMDLLKQLGYDCAQGFLFSAAINATRFGQLLQNQLQCTHR